MSTELQIRTEQSTWTPAQKSALVAMGLDKCPEGDLTRFFATAQRTGLDPFAGQIVMIPRKTGQVTKWTIQTTIEGYRIAAARTGKFAGYTPTEWCGTDGVWRDVWLDVKPPAACRVGVYVVGMAAPIFATVLLREFKTSDHGPWGTMPAHMLAVRAETHALRRAFPADMAGLEGDASAPAEIVDMVTGEIRTQATAAQLQEVSAAAKAAGHTTPEEILEAVSAVLGRPIANAFDLTNEDVATILAAFQEPQ